MANENKQLAPVDQFRRVLAKKEDEIWKTRAPWMTLDKENFFARSMMAISMNRDIAAMLTTTPGKISVLQCIIDACQMGMSLGGAYPQATIMPKGGKAILVPDAQALIAFCMAQPAIIRSIHYEIIYSNESIVIKNKLGKTVDECVEYGPFDRKKFDGDKGDPEGAWAFVVDIDGKPKFVYLSKKDIDRIKGDSKSTAWSAWWERMGEKSIVKHILKPYLKRKFVNMNLALPIYDESAPDVMTDEEAADYQDMSTEERVLQAMPDPVVTPVPDEPEKEKSEPTQGRMF